MATPDWTTVPDTNLEPGDPIRSIDIIAINNHTAAQAGGATGAPKTTLMAIEALNSGTVIRSRKDDIVTTYNTLKTVHSFAFAQIGTINAYVEHSASSGTTSIIGIVRIRNGSETTIASWSTTSSSAIPRNSDVDVLPGDEVKIQIAGTSSTIPSAARYARFRTNGENLWPGNAARLENDYTVV